MSKPSDDLSALFRSLRPDETSLQEGTDTAARNAEQRWPLFRAVAPEKPHDTPQLSAQERQRWISQEKIETGGRKPALSLPGLSDKMSKELDKMSVRAVKNTASVKPAMRREPEMPVVERVAERPRTGRATLQTSPPENRSSPAARSLAADSNVVSSGVGVGIFDKKPAVSAPVLAASERDQPATLRGDDSLRSTFSRLETKAEAVAKPAVNRSSFLDRLGKR